MIIAGTRMQQRIRDRLNGEARNVLMFDVCITNHAREAMP
jgi:hypothetical protein